MSVDAIVCRRSSRRCLDLVDEKESIESTSSSPSLSGATPGLAGVDEK